MRHAPRRVAFESAKRAFDVFGAALGLVLTLPLQTAIAVTVATRLGRPVLFKQDRAGRDGKVFTLVKFRTMRVPDPDRGLVSDEQRLTSFGKRLRSTSLDELPTLFNVLRGDMSIVGPRPLLVEYLERYTPEQARRHEVRPGVTGLAQVNGRNALDWTTKLALDLEYVQTRSFLLDLRIIGRTLRSVLFREGISADGEATAAEFMGTK